jgi:ABC-type uncharacterized transport system permease subunit
MHDTGQFKNFVFRHPFKMTSIFIYTKFLPFVSLGLEIWYRPKAMNIGREYSGFMGYDAM